MPDPPDYSIGDLFRNAGDRMNRMHGDTAAQLSSIAARLRDIESVAHTAMDRVTRMLAENADHERRIAALEERCP